MSRLTEEVIRRKAEHHDGLITDLEEISLHQLELERIEVVGTLCRKLRILYLQNNIIPRIENLQHLKDLRYLNLALNNITVIEGLAACEFLNKLDLTVNFIDVDSFEESLDNLSGLLHLKDLYLMGNPCMEWPGAREFLFSKLPQVERLDGQEISKSDKISAAQRYKDLLTELRALAAAKRQSKGLEAVVHSGAGTEADDDSEPWCPETRTKMYREMAESKLEQEKRKEEMQPKKRDPKKEQVDVVGATRVKESAGHIRQCNEGRWIFELVDEDGKGNVVLRLQLSKYLDSSLIDADVHPKYVSVVVKGKVRTFNMTALMSMFHHSDTRIFQVFRLSLPEEVNTSKSACQRSQTTGELVVTMPKVTPNPMLAASREKEKCAPTAASAKQIGTSIRTVAPCKLADEVG
jgi:protein TilB